MTFRRPTHLGLRAARALCLTLSSVALSGALSLVARAADDPPSTRPLTLDGAVERALATSFVLQAAGARVEQAEANVARAGYERLPRVSALGRYTRLSPAQSGSLGTLVAAPGAAAGPLPDGAPLVGVPVNITQLDDRYLVGGTASIPATDYLWRYPQSRRAAVAQARAEPRRRGHHGRAARRRARAFARAARHDRRAHRRQGRPGRARPRARRRALIRPLRAAAA